MFKLDKEELPEFTEGLFLGAQDDVLAIELAYSIFPILKMIPDPNGDTVMMIIEDISIEEHNNHGWWKATANYKFSFNEGKSGTAGLDPSLFVLPQIRVNFTVGNSTKHITKAPYGTVSDKRNDYPNNPPDLLGAIGVSRNGITGADVPDKTLVVQITAYYRPWYINNRFIQGLKDLVGHVNREIFMSQFPREVMFMGASGGGGVLDIIPITFDFDIKESYVGDVADDPGFPSLQGRADPHDIIDYLYIPSTRQDGGGKTFTLQYPVFRYIHSVSLAKSFGIFGFGIS